MPLCASVPATVDTDLNVHNAYLTDLDKCMKNFNNAITATMNAYRNLLSAFDQVGQVYGNVAQTCSHEVNKPVREFRDGMRDMKDKGGFESFNREIHEGTTALMDPIKQGLKHAMKTAKEVKARQKEYDTVRYDLDTTEKSYAKKDKPLAESKGYKKNLAKREKTKEVFEAKREEFSQEIEALQHTTESLLLRSLNNYLRCTANFCGKLETTMISYRVDMTTAEKQRVMSVNKLKEAQDRAAAANAMSNISHDIYPAETVNANANANNEYTTEQQAPQEHRKSDDFYPTEEQPNTIEGNGNRYPEEEPGPNPLNLQAQSSRED